jgi:hypothetical protein
MSLPNSNVASRLAAARARNAQQLEASSSLYTFYYTSEYKRFKTWVREHGVIVDNGNRFSTVAKCQPISATIWPHSYWGTEHHASYTSIQELQWDLDKKENLASGFQVESDAITLAIESNQEG